MGVVTKLARHTPTLTAAIEIRALSADSALFAHLSDAITALTNDSEWEEVGDSVADIVAAAKETVESWYSDMLIGQVAHFVDSAPLGWLELDGTQYVGADYPELFDKIPAAWIAGPNFTLPDTDGIFLNGVGQAGTIGETGGANSYELTAGQLPAHSHLYTMPVAAADTVGAGAPIPSVMSVTPSTPTSDTGAGDSIDNRPLFLALVMAVFAGR